MNFLNELSKKAGKKVYDLASKVEGGRDCVASVANSFNLIIKGKDPRVYLKSGNIIQFISRASGRTIQVVVSKNANQLVCDAIGGTGSLYQNSCWLVICTSEDHYYFRNTNNYLAIKDGRIVIIPSLIDEEHPIEAKFRVQDVLGSAHAIYLESVQTPGYYLRFDENGVPCDDMRLKEKSSFSQFEIYPITDGLDIQPEQNYRDLEMPESSPPPSYSEATSASNNPYGAAAASLNEWKNELDKKENSYK